MYVIFIISSLLLHNFHLLNSLVHSLCFSHKWLIGTMRKRFCKWFPESQQYPGFSFDFCLIFNQPNLNQHDHASNHHMIPIDYLILNVYSASILFMTYDISKAKKGIIKKKSIVCQEKKKQTQQTKPQSLFSSSISRKFFIWIQIA